MAHSDGVMYHAVTYRYDTMGHFIFHWDQSLKL